MLCAFCRREMRWVHGHAACTTDGCPLRGANQAPCCDGETAATCPAPTADVAGGPLAPGQFVPPRRSGA